MLQELLDILDEEILTKLLFRYAGFSFYIPHEPTLSHPFSLVLSEKEFLQLTEEFGGQTITLPSAKTWLKQFQRRKIHQLKQQNMKHRDIGLASSLMFW